MVELPPLITTIFTLTVTFLVGVATGITIVYGKINDKNKKKDNQAE